MANRTATLYIHYKKADGTWAYAKPVVKANGRLKPLSVLVEGNEKHHPEARYKVSWYKSGQKRFEDVGQDADVAVAALNRREKALEAIAAGLEVKGEGKDKGRVSVSAAISVYLSDAKDGKAPKTYSSRKRTLELFGQSCSKIFLDQLETRDILDFRGFLKRQGFADRTVFNHFETVNSFLRANGIKDIVPKHEWPRFDEKPVKKYQPEELAKLFKVANERESLLFQFFLGSGGREGEVARLKWPDIDFKDKKVLFVSQQGASTKNRKSRPVPLPDRVIAALKKYQSGNRHTEYVFPNGQGGIEGHFLRVLKNLAHRAKLNCGHCKGVGEKKQQNCKEHAVCGEWELHRFRKTFASTHLHNGANIRQIQKWLGHHSLDVTLAYLADEDDTSEPVRKQVNAAFSRSLSPR
ncbi:MAG TPA: site-specific integrase [Candidatus Sulfotelmatobacter sp.]|nr:site-specific integrase [Candidatus Sulfotelmatobacter sp.]